MRESISLIYLNVFFGLFATNVVAAIIQDRSEMLDQSGHFNYGFPTREYYQLILNYTL